MRLSETVSYRQKSHSSVEEEGGLGIICLGNQTEPGGLSLLLSVAAHAGLLGMLYLLLDALPDKAPELIAINVSLATEEMFKTSKPSDEPQPAPVEPTKLKASPSRSLAVSRTLSTASEPSTSIPPPLPQATAEDQLILPMTASQSTSERLSNDGRSLPSQPNDRSQSGEGERTQALPQYRMGDADTPIPAYPPGPRRRGREGSVLVRLEVGADGRPESATIVESSGEASLDEAAVTTLKRWRLRPATRFGKPVPGAVLVPVRFQLH